MDARPTRRAVLLAAAAAGLSACVPRRQRRRTADPDAALLDAARRDEVSLIAGYDALISSDRRRAASLSTLRDEHVAHLRALGGALTPTPTPSRTVASGGAPLDLVAAERAAARNRGRDAGRAQSPSHAQLLASIAGAEAAHADLLPALHA